MSQITRRFTVVKPDGSEEITYGYSRACMVASRDLQPGQTSRVITTFTREKNDECQPIR
jgi:hypothetical protein